MNILGPNRLFLEITTECNLKCKLCKLWQNRDDSSKITLEDKINFLDNLKNWLEHNSSPLINNFSIVLTGGEPFLYPKEIFKILEKCQKLGFFCFINTNGTLLEPWLLKIPKSGLTAITFSIDSHISTIHDDLRGVAGTFNKAVKNIKKLLVYRKKFQSDLKIYIQSILGTWNINNLEEQINWVKNLGVDGIMFQCIQFPFGIPIPAEWHKDFPYFPNPETIQKMIDTILKFKRKNGIIANAVNEIKWWTFYFNNPEVLPENIHVCRAYDQNLIVDIYGNVKFCFNKYLEPPNRIGNVLKNALNDLWTGNEALTVKEEMKKCHRACGIMICHCDTNIREYQK